MKDISSEIDWDNLDIGAVEDSDEIAKQISSENSEPSPDWSTNIGQAAARIINKKLHGYQAELKEHEQISLIMLDSATPGRMALIYYQEFLPADYFTNLDAWIDDFSWYQRYSIEVPNGKKTDKRTQWRFVPPSPYSIADTVYGKSLSDTLKKTALRSTSARYRRRNIRADSRRFGAKEFSGSLQPERLRKLGVAKKHRRRLRPIQRLARPSSRFIATENLPYELGYPKPLA